MDLFNRFRWQRSMVQWMIYAWKTNAFRMGRWFFLGGTLNDLGVVYGEYREDWGCFPFCCWNRGLRVRLKWKCGNWNTNHSCVILLIISWLLSVRWVVLSGKELRSMKKYRFTTFHDSTRAICWCCKWDLDFLSICQDSAFWYILSVNFGTKTFKKTNNNWWFRLAVDCPNNPILQSIKFC